jgi:hypothetical protein
LLATDSQISQKIFSEIGIVVRERGQSWYLRRDVF